MQERLTGESPRKVFEETLVSEAERFQKGQGDSHFRKPTHSLALEGAREYLGLNGDRSLPDHLVFMQAANRFLAERGVHGVAVEVKVTQETVYAPDGTEQNQSYWRPLLLNRSGAQGA